MTNEIVKYKWQDKDIALTKSDVRNLISTDPSVTDKEIALFMQLCKYQSLNPFVREAYLIKYGSYPASIVVGKEVFTKRAENNPDFDGYEITDNYVAGMDLNEFEVTCKVFRKNLEHHIAVTVSYSEYAGTDSKGNVNRMWKSKPRTMLRKVALMQGLREAFSTALGGLYEEHELDQKAMPKDIIPKSEEGIDRDDEAIEEAEVIEEEKAKQEEDEIDYGIDPNMDASIDKSIKTEAIEPASEKQKDYIYGLSKCKQCKKEFQGFKCPYCGAKNTKDKEWIKILKKGIIHSSHITPKEIINRIGDPKKIDINKASEAMRWWWGDKDKNIIGEREKREKNPKIGESDLERRSDLMREVLVLMKKNYIHKPMQKKFYKKYQKDEIKQLTTEELAELKGELEHYVPDWK